MIGHNMRLRSIVTLFLTAFVASIPASAQPGRCDSVGGVLMTNIAAIDGVYNLGPVFGDLQGSVAAKILGQNSDGSFNVQHSWVTTSGDIILMKVAILKPTYPVTNGMFIDRTIVGVPWGNYLTEISGGTGRFVGATGTISYFGMADFSKNTLVLRYSGTVCYKNPQ